MVVLGSFKSKFADEACDGCPFYACPGHLAETGAGLRRNLGSQRKMRANVGYCAWLQQTGGRLGH